MQFYENYHSQGIWNCAGCKEDKCFYKKPVIDLKAVNMPPIRGVTVDNAFEIIPAPFLASCRTYGLCPWPLFDSMVIHIYEMYVMLGGVSRLSTPTQIYELPAIYVNACKIIDAERAKIRKAREK